MRAILIDPLAREVRLVEITKNYRDIYRELTSPLKEVTCFTSIMIDRRNSLFVDDEGLLHSPHHFFIWAGYAQPIAGRGLIVGISRTGESVTCTLDLEYVKGKVSWHKLKVKGFETTEGETTIFGEPAKFISTRPILEPDSDH